MSEREAIEKVKIEELKYSMNDGNEDEESISVTRTPSPVMRKKVTPIPSSPLELVPAPASLQETAPPVRDSPLPSVVPEQVTSTSVAPTLPPPPPMPMAQLLTTPMEITSTSNTTSNGSTKPVETMEARQKRRENHRLVERRRRETINNGIDELALTIPGNPKKRSTVILRAIEHIRELERIKNESTEELIRVREENQLLITELANKNKKINELLLML